MHMIISIDSSIYSWHDKFQLLYHSHSFKVIFRGFHDNLLVEKFKECLKKLKKIKNLKIWRFQRVFQQKVDVMTTLHNSVKNLWVKGNHLKNPCFSSHYLFINAVSGDFTNHEVI